jgi:hypothetical protein
MVHGEVKFSLVSSFPQVRHGKANAKIAGFFGGDRRQRL